VKGVNCFPEWVHREFKTRKGVAIKGIEKDKKKLIIGLKSTIPILGREVRTNGRKGAL